MVSAGKVKFRQLSDEIMTWGVVSSSDYRKRLKTFEKTNRVDVANCLVNLQKYLDELNAGNSPKHLYRGFLHAEQGGVWAIDPTGVKGTQKKALRLYVFPFEPTETLYVLILGDKGTQSEDVRLCAATAREILRDHESGDSKE